MSVAKWLVELGENGYGKINIHVDHDNVFRWACRHEYWTIATWLIELGKNGYGELKQEIITAYYRKDKKIEYLIYDKSNS